MGGDDDDVLLQRLDATLRDARVLLQPPFLLAFCNGGGARERSEQAKAGRVHARTSSAPNQRFRR
jgi:hypothetical protein